MDFSRFILFLMNCSLEMHTFIFLIETTGRRNNPCVEKEDVSFESVFTSQTNVTRLFEPQKDATRSSDSGIITA